MRRPRTMGSALESLVFVSALILVLAGCGSSSNGSAAATTAPTATTAPVSTASTAASTSATSTTSAAATTAPTAAATATAAASPSTGSTSAASPAASPVARGTAALLVKTDAKLGPILTDSLGMVLYTYGKDTANTSNCYGQCATNWPPLLATVTPSLPSGTPGTLGTTTRQDGSKQVTYNGKPLYYFINDRAPGDTKGQGLAQNAWLVVPPAAS